MMLLPQIAGRLFNTPLMIQRGKLETILSVLRPKFAGATLPSIENVMTNGYDVSPDGIARIPIYGTLVRRAYGLMAQSGLTSYSAIAEQLEMAVNDSGVRGIMLDIDSPGGDAGGVFDLADRIFAARGVKPIWAVANEDAFSAAYMLAAATGTIYVPRTGGVGSIGVIAVHVDQSVADDDAGLNYTAIYEGERKNDLSPHEPLSDPARAALQAEVKRLYDLFVGSVARMRGLDIGAVKATEAGVFFGEDALTAQLADKLGTFDEAMEDFAARLPRTNKFIQPMQQKELRMSNNLPTTEASVDQGMPDIATLRQEAMAEAQKHALAYVGEVTELCQLAGMADKAHAFIASVTPVEDVCKALLSARAVADDASAIAAQIPAGTTLATPKIDTAAIYASRNQKKG